MEEKSNNNNGLLSWRAKLAKANINITHIDFDNDLVYFDFAYRPHSGGTPKWAKTVTHLVYDTYKALYDDKPISDIREACDLEATADHLREVVLSLRKELEG